MGNRKEYQQPVAAVLGQADQLTLGDIIGCRPDGVCCEKSGVEEEAN